MGARENLEAFEADVKTAADPRDEQGRPWGGKTVATIRTARLVYDRLSEAEQHECERMAELYPLHMQLSPEDRKKLHAIGEKLPGLVDLERKRLADEVRSERRAAGPSAAPAPEAGRAAGRRV